MAQWEAGSFRDLGWLSTVDPMEDTVASPAVAAVLDRALMFGSGRASLLWLLRGVARDAGHENGGLRCHVPSYFCPDVVDSLRAAGCQIEFYRHTPWRPASSVPGVRDGDVVINANLFGVFSADLSDSAAAQRAVVIEDHTHDPFSAMAMRSMAHLAFASLRKAVPIPDGAYAFSRSTTPEATGAVSVDPADDPRVVAQGAMRAKALYLAGDPAGKKGEYLAAFRHAEEAFARHSSPALRMSPTSLLMFERAPIARWRERHRANHDQLRASLENLGLNVLSPSTGSFFGVLLTFDRSEVADTMSRRLVDRAVYAARLWRLPDSQDYDLEARDLGERSLFLHCDERYSSLDIERIVSIVGDAM